MEYRPLKQTTAVDWLTHEAKYSCEHPQRIKKYDYNQKKFIWTEVPCGKCEFCLYQKQQEWVKRMQYESHPEINKYVYFVTLTYDSQFLKNYPQYREETYAIKHKGEWLPLLLCRKHLQLFFTRLRKAKKCEFTYFATGEYGDKHSRPHFHFILWSNTPFSQADMEAAWTLKKQLIGLVHYQDLVANGTLHDLRSDSPTPLDDVNSKYVSEYVNSYVCKLEHDPLDLMYTKDLIKKVYKRKFIKTIKYDRPLNRDCTHINRNDKIKIYTLLEKHGKEFEDYAEFHEQTKQYYQYKTVEEFFKQFTSYTVCSKGHSIGARYIEKYIQTADDTLKRHHDKHTGKQIQVPSSIKRKLTNSMANILPIDVLNYNCRYGDLHDIPEILLQIHEHISNPMDENRLFDYRDTWLFTDRKLFYSLKSTGNVNLYDYDTADYLETISLDEFEERLNLCPYFQFKEKYDKEMTEYRESREQFYNDMIKRSSIEDVGKYISDVRKEHKRLNKKKQQEYKFRKNRF